MTIDGLLLLIVLVIGIFLGLWLLMYALVLLLDGAMRLFVYAGEQGFVGLAAYIALWVIALPVMIVVCILIGLIRKMAAVG